MGTEVGGHLLRRHAEAAVPRDPHDILAELFRIGLRRTDISLRMLLATSSA
ncbi:hypothetical protein ACU686_16705 [Yinghuangia aomiensis]